MELVQGNLAEKARGGLPESLKGMRDGEGITFEEMSRRTGISRSTISQIANQGLTPKPAHAEKLWAIYDEVMSTRAQLDMGIPAVPVSYKTGVELYETREYREAMGWCAYVFKKRKMGILIGHPGSGKTTVLRQFAKAQPGVLYIEAWHTMRIGDLLGSIGDALGVEMKGNSHQKAQRLISVLRGRTDVMIAVDEAEYLCQRDVNKIEVLRKIWDNTGTPIILCGTSALEDKVTHGVGSAGNLAQLYRRKVELKLTGIGKSETRSILREYNVTPEAADALAAIAADVKHGGMGTFTEILELCLEAAERGPITAEILASAKRYKLMY